MSSSNFFTTKADLKSEYQRKLVSADEAVKVVKSGDKVHLGGFGGICRDLEAALARRVDELEDVTLYSTLWSLPGTYKTLEADKTGEHFKLFSTHMSKKDRVINKRGQAWFVPILFHEGNKNYRENYDLNVAFVMTGPIDKHGNFNFGITNAEQRGIIDNADIVILEANRAMPRCHGIDQMVNISEVDYVVDANYPLPELPIREPKPEEAKIAEYILPLIEEGSCLQLGIGAIPNHLGELINQTDLGNFSVHTEMLVDSFVDMYEAGKITGGKSRDHGKMVYTFALGTKKLYDFLDDNPICCSGPVNYVNDMDVIGSIDKMVSVNACLQIDLYGQVNAESIGPLHISGTGGMLDFVEGAFMSNGGKSIICTPSTKTLKDGTVESLILPYMQPGSIVSCPRASVMYLVTEYGIAYMKGKSTWERAEQIINLAHPDYREDLIKAAEKQGIWRQSSKLI
ncbi:MAG: acetyl-CoA hydrolase/transferase family protein [Anaerovoracaceae bacterium]|jgi:acyl-CoA hydrolase